MFPAVIKLPRRSGMFITRAGNSRGNGCIHELSKAIEHEGGHISRGLLDDGVDGDEGRAERASPRECLGHGRQTSFGHYLAEDKGKFRGSPSESPSESPANVFHFLFFGWISLRQPVYSRNDNKFEMETRGLAGKKCEIMQRDFTGRHSAFGTGDRRHVLFFVIFVLYISFTLWIVDSDFVEAGKGGF